MDRSGSVRAGAQIPKDYSNRRVGELAAKCRVTIERLGDTHSNLISFLNDKQGPIVLSEYQHFAIAVNAAVDCDFDYLQAQQDTYGDLVPDHPVDDCSVSKFFERNNFWEVDA